MLATKTKHLLLFVLFVILQTHYFSFSQIGSFPVDDWVKRLSERTDSFNDKFWTFTVQVRSLDSSRINSILNEMQKKGANSGKRFQIRLKLIKAQLMYLKYRPQDYDTINILLRQALYDAYELDDLVLAELASRHLGEMNYFAGKLEPAAMYGLNAVELLGKIGGKINPYESYIYWQLGEILYHTGEYEKSIDYTLQAFNLGLDVMYPDRSGRMMGWNTIGMCYQQLQKYDSALIAFEKTLQIANTNHNQVWVGIGGGNKAKVFFQQKKFKEAKPLLAFDYAVSNQNHIYDNAAYSLQWLALINLHEGKKDSALKKAREALKLFSREPSRQPFLGEIYNTLGEVYRSTGEIDSFYYYTQLATHTRDSLARVMAVSQAEIVRIKLDHEQNVLKIKNFQKEKEAERLTRNFIIAAIALIAIIALLLLNRQRLKLRHSRELALQEKAAAESEVASARAQLLIFTQNIIEKSSLIEKLEQQIKLNENNFEQQQLIEELTHQAILTEDDWEKFRTLFEKIHPGFFRKLKESVTDITIAEQRMAALTRLHLNTKQMAALLGISPNSVNKTRQRLRQRLNLQLDSNIEEFVTKL